MVFQRKFRMVLAGTVLGASHLMATSAYADE